MSNYTAGPWQVQDPSVLLSMQIVKQPDKCICTVYKLFREDAEVLANARLIAAAPELLEAAMDLFADASDRGEIFDADETMHDDWAALKKAIDKALGVAS